MYCLRGLASDENMTPTGKCRVSLSLRNNTIVLFIHVTPRSLQKPVKTSCHSCLTQVNKCQDVS